MKIHNVRLGFATNSSSSHSIIFNPNIGFDYDDPEDSFGWNFFTASSPESKDLYMSCMLRQNLLNTFPDDIVDAITKGLGLPEVDRDQWGYGRSIDHQSLHNLPTRHGQTTVDLEFFKEFRQYILRDGVHILGGNDNDDTDHKLSGPELDLGGWTSDMNPFTCRKDGDWWVLYSPISGHRIVLTFNDNAEPYVPAAPMLMDVKITDFCTHGCAYCYQGSTPAGGHMDHDKVYTYASMIASSKVFEVAIGGGEPTQCPEFEQFLYYLKQMGVVANFTTKSVDWLEDVSRASRILPNIGAFAFSADGQALAQLKRIKVVMDYHNYDLKKFTIQVVPATMTKYQLEQILTWAQENHIRVTLLGYKESGRGSRYKEIALTRRWDRFDESEWLSVVKALHEKHRLGQLSIDTTLASRYLQNLKDAGIPDWLYHVDEGMYSMYIDFVQLKYGPSSYHTDKLMSFELHKKSVSDMFKEIEPV